MKVNIDNPGDDVQIQIIPLIDVIFCILTFFILAALQLTRQQAINVDLPKATTGQTQLREMLVVTIDSTGQTFVDQQPIDRSQLLQVLQNYRQQQPNGLLVLNASKTAFYNDVIQVLDLLRAVGGDRVALATIPTEAVPPSPGVAPSAPTGTPVNPLQPFGNPNAPVPASPNSLLTPAPTAPAPGGQAGTPAPAAPAPQISPR